MLLFHLSNPPRPYNKVHNRGCSLSTFFFILYAPPAAPTEEEKRRHLPQEKGASGECIYKESRLGSKQHSASAGNKQKRMLNYLQETKVPASSTAMAVLFIFSLSMSSPRTNTFIPDSHGKVLDSDGVVWWWWWWLTHAHSLDDSGVMVLCCKGVALLFPVCLSQDT